METMLDNVTVKGWEDSRFMSEFLRHLVTEAGGEPDLEVVFEKSDVDEIKMYGTSLLTVKLSARKTLVGFYHELKKVLEDAKKSS